MSIKKTILDTAKQLDKKTITPAKANQVLQKEQKKDPDGYHAAYFELLFIEDNKKVDKMFNMVRDHKIVKSGTAKRKNIKINVVQTKQKKGEQYGQKKERN